MRSFIVRRRRGWLATGDFGVWITEGVGTRGPELGAGVLDCRHDGRCSPAGRVGRGVDPVLWDKRGADGVGIDATQA